MIILWLLLSVTAWAQEPVYWSHLLKLSERHEFYKDHETIVSPKESWQSIFSVSYVDRELNRFKDCLFYKVPGTENGTLKLKTIPAVSKCDDFMFQAGDKEISNIKSLQYAITDTNVVINMTFADYRLDKWTGKFQSSFTRPDPKMALSSVQFKSPRIIFLAPKIISPNIGKGEFLKEGTLCHNINEDCEEMSPSTCGQCSEGWYEVPNGCAQGPKYCGRHNCGGKDQPACRRGMKWQKKEEPFECRIDSSFVYCENGLSVQCDGKKAFCR